MVFSAPLQARRRQSRKFQKIRGRVEAAFSQRLWCLCLTQSTQALHADRRFEQEHRLRQWPNILCPGRRSLLQTGSEKFYERCGSRQQALISSLRARIFAQRRISPQKILRQTSEQQTLSAQRRLGKLLNLHHRATPISWIDAHHIPAPSMRRRRQRAQPSAIAPPPVHRGA